MESDDEGTRGEVRIVNPPELSPPLGFAHAAAWGGWIWLGGQSSTDVTGRVLYAGDIVSQFRQAIRNVSVALEAAGSSPRGVVKLTYYVTDVAAYRSALGPIGAAYREVMGRHYPASSLFEVKGLFEPDAMVEIECVAIADEYLSGRGVSNDS